MKIDWSPNPLFFTTSNIQQTRAYIQGNHLRIAKIIFFYYLMSVKGALPNLLRNPMDFILKFQGSEINLQSRFLGVCIFMTRLMSF